MNTTPYVVFSDEEMHSHTALELNAMIVARREELRPRCAASYIDRSESRLIESGDRCSDSK
jgi:hypothetical protein